MRLEKSGFILAGFLFLMAFDVSADEGIVLTLKSEKRAYRFGEEIKIELHIKNTSERPVALLKEWMTLEVKDSSQGVNTIESLFRSTPTRSISGMEGGIKLSPGNSFREVFHFDRWQIEIKEKGEPFGKTYFIHEFPNQYQIQGVYRGLPSVNTVTIRVSDQGEEFIAETETPVLIEEKVEPPLFEDEKPSFPPSIFPEPMLEEEPALLDKPKEEIFFQPTKEEDACQLDEACFDIDCSEYDSSILGRAKAFCLNGQCKCVIGAYEIGLSETAGSKKAF